MLNSKNNQESNRMLYQKQKNKFFQIFLFLGKYCLLIKLLPLKQTKPLKLDISSTFSLKLSTILNNLIFTIFL